MTLEEAKTKILKEGGLKKIVKIFEFDDFWSFSDGEIREARSPAIRKKDGSLFGFFPPDFDIEYLKRCKIISLEDE